MASTIDTLTGNGDQGYSGDDGPAGLAELNEPNDVATDGDGFIVSDTQNNRVREVYPDGDISTIAGGGSSTASSGSATLAELDSPTGVVASSSGTIYIADTLDDRVVAISPSGQMTTIAGQYQDPGSSGDGGPATQAQLDLPKGVAVSSSGDVFISDTGNDRIQEVQPEGVISTLTAGTAQVRLGSPTAVSAGNNGSVYREWRSRLLRRRLTGDRCQAQQAPWRRR